MSPPIEDDEGFTSPEDTMGFMTREARSMLLDHPANAWIKRVNPLKVRQPNTSIRALKEIITDRGIEEIRELTDLLSKTFLSIGASTLDAKVSANALLFSKSKRIRNIVRKCKDMAGNYYLQVELLKHLINSNQIDQAKQLLKHPLLASGLDRLEPRIIDALLTPNEDKKNDIYKLIVDQDITEHNLLHLLERAVENGHKRAVQICLEKRAALYPHTTIDVRLLHTAVSQGNVKITNMLLNAENQGVIRGKINSQNQKGETAAIVATKARYSEILERLVFHKASPNAPDDRGRTPLHHAGINGDDELLQWWLDQGADGTIKDKDGLTAYEYYQL
ncbi:ankyrin repeat domain-containing protein [Endozoicomonas sp. Mp262]|uniref:ankyrin repeat domain-containing protein n=1 Tax=Endozoicomonas sp. Mp262 TaxID=2919499 RepID=UPI0021DAB770